jgi:beta-N-acetylhexosaminidase
MSKDASTTEVDLTAAPFHLDADAVAWVEQTLAGLSIEQKAGQLFGLPVFSTDPADLETVLAVTEPGVMMLRPMPGEAADAIVHALRQRCSIPPLIAANLDQGPDGAVSEATSFSSPLGIGATRDPRHARRLGEVDAIECGWHGVRWNFGPVVDLDLNDYNPMTNTRTFGSDPEVIADLAVAEIEGMQSNGMAACAKHFPGDGVDDRDQHIHPTINSLPMDEWRASYGRVWQRVIDAGVLSIMVGHIALPAYSRQAGAAEPPLPASLSPEILQGLVRGELGFNGLISTDATLMGGFSMVMPRAQAVPAAIAAGCDLFLFALDLPTDFQFMLDGIRSGVISPERLDAAVRRILGLKAAIGLHREAAPTAPDDHDAVRARHHEWARECARDAVTLVKDLDDIVPLDPNRYPRVLVYPLDRPGRHSPASERLAARLRDKGFEVTVFQYPPADDVEAAIAGDFALTVSKTRDEYDLVLYVAAIPQLSFEPGIRLTWSPVIGSNAPHALTEVPTVFVSFESPYHLRDVPRIRTYVNAYTDSEMTAEAVADALTGASEFRGTSPVDPFCGYEDTHW